MLQSSTLNGDMCLLYHVQSNETIMNFHISMIYSNPKLPLIPLNCRIVEDCESLVYSPKGLHHSETFIETSNSINDVIYVIRKMISELLLLVDYQLILSCILFDPQYCFIDASTKSIKWIYLPIHSVTHADGTESIKRMINSMMMIILNRQDLQKNLKHQNYILQIVLLIQREYTSINELVLALSKLEVQVFESIQTDFIKAEFQVTAASPSEKSIDATPANDSWKLRFKDWIGQWINRSKTSNPMPKNMVPQERFLSNTEFKPVRVDPEKEWEYCDTYGELVSVPKSDETKIMNSSIGSKPTLNESNSYIHETVLINKRHDKSNKLILKTPNGSKTYSLDQPIITIGRNPAVNLIVIPDQVVGRCHAEIHKLDEILFIKDLNSANGTFINQVRVIPDLYHKIQLGDIITLGNSEVVIA